MLRGGKQQAIFCRFREKTTGHIPRLIAGLRAEMFDVFPGNRFHTGLRKVLGF